MLANRPLCALCRTPTRVRCSRCKIVYYCSLECQGKHWKEGHRVECKLLTGSLDPAATPIVKKQPMQGGLTKPKKVLFPYESFVRFFHFDGLGVPCGLTNCGNSCYANVILQCLTYTRPLAAYLLQRLHKSRCRRSNWCFMCELQEHVVKAFQSSTPFSPIKILSRLRSIGNSLGYGRQEDAHEFMRYAVDTMQKICLDEAGGDSVLDARTQETTLVQHIFGGHLQSQVTCSQCFQESNRYDNMLDLTVEIQGSVETLEDALRQFTAAEWLDGDNKYDCSRCNAYVPARKRLFIYNAPNILTIALKRFQGGKFGKLNKKVAFPETLDIGPYMSSKGDVPPAYNLYALVVHLDMLNASYFGHYVCFLKDERGTWYKVDDNKVKAVEIERVLSQKAYMLFYSRSTVRQGPIVDDRTPASSTTSTWDSGVLEASASEAGEISSEATAQRKRATAEAAAAAARRTNSMVEASARRKGQNSAASKSRKNNQVESSDSSMGSGLSAGKRGRNAAAVATSSSCNNRDRASSAGPTTTNCGREVVGTGSCDDMEVEVEGSVLQSTLTSLAGDSSNLIVSSTAPEHPPPAAAARDDEDNDYDDDDEPLEAKRPRSSSSQADETEAGPDNSIRQFSEEFKPMLRRGFLNRSVVALPRPCS